MTTVIFAVIALSLIVVIAIILIYNRLVSFKHKTKDAWSGVEVQLKRRYDLIPNLLETLKAYMSHEKGIFELISDSRSKALHAQTIPEFGVAENQLNKALHTLIARAEDTPEIKADTTFLEFQRTLNDIEKQIELSRRYFNAVVRDNNTAVETFPGIIFAGAFGFTVYDYFEVDGESERANPKIVF